MFNIDDDIRKASTLPSLFYRDKEIFRKVVKKVFSNSWQYITDLSNLNEDKIIKIRFSVFLMFVHTEVIS